VPEEARTRGKIISCALGIPPLVAGLMAQRGIQDASCAEAFLRAELVDLEDPNLLTDMDKAVSRLIRAIEGGEKIRVYGDYDVDGITSICVLVDVLRSLGAEIDYYIPDRVDEGYGMNPEAVKSIARDGVTLLVTVDCGITAFAEVELARSLGMDVIITDHHEPHGGLPSAVAVINPKRDDEKYPFRDLAGVGVAYKLACALLMTAKRIPDANDPPDRLLDLVALGTIADVCPLTGENRIYAKQGLAKMNRTDNLGLKSLIEVCGLADRRITAGTVGFVIAPRLNAAGRIRDASLCAELLLTDSPKEGYGHSQVFRPVSTRRGKICSGADIR
jgi:single-stranded-DNA-specific exonuclease